MYFQTQAGLISPTLPRHNETKKVTKATSNFNARNAIKSLLHAHSSETLSLFVHTGKYRTQLVRAREK